MQNSTKRKYPVKRMKVSINMEKTGAHIKRSLKESGYTMREIMEITGITTEQTIYKWYSGKSIPSLETQIILCRLLGLRITELLVLDEEFGLSEDNDLPEGSPDHKKIEPMDRPMMEFIDRQKQEELRHRRLTAYYHRLCPKTA